MDQIDKLLESYVKLMPKTVYLVKNKDKYPTIEKAVREISDMALSIDNEAKIKIKPDELTGTTMCLTITTNVFVVDMIDKFCDLLKEASTFEACPLTNGMLSVSITFQDAWVPAPTK